MRCGLTKTSFAHSNTSDRLFRSLSDHRQREHCVGRAIKGESRYLNAVTPCIVCWDPLTATSEQDECGSKQLG